MKKLFLLSMLWCAQSYAQVAFSAFADTGYQGGGTHSATASASGTNLVCMVFVWYRFGSVSSVTCGGNAMTLVNSHTTTIRFSATVDAYIYAGPGLTAGGITASGTATSEISLQVVVFSGGRQGNAVDAAGPFTSGTVDGSSQFGLPITTVANNSMVLGVFNPNGSFFNSPSSDATYGGLSGGGIALFYWYSTSDVTPAGSFTAQAKTSGSGQSVEGWAYSIAPALSNAVTANPTVIVVGPQ